MELLLLTYVELLHRLDISPRVARRVGVGVIQPLLPVEVLRCRVALLLVHVRHQVFVDLLSDHGFHHGKMLEIVVCLEQGIAGVELDQNTADAPNVARKAPTQVENDFWGAVVARRDNGGVVLVIECS